MSVVSGGVAVVGVVVDNITGGDGDDVGVVVDVGGVVSWRDVGCNGSNVGGVVVDVYGWIGVVVLGYRRIFG